MLGSLLLFIFGVFSVWADIEASLFKMDRADVDQSPRFHYPVIIMPNETGIISLEQKNPWKNPLLSKSALTSVTVYVIFVREYRYEVSSEPGESERLAWEVTAKDAAYDRFGLVGTHKLENSTFPYQNSACGILLVNIPFLPAPRWFGWR